MAETKKKKKGLIEFIILIAFIIIVGVLALIFWNNLKAFFKTTVGYIVLGVCIVLFFVNLILGHNPQWKLFKTGANLVLNMGNTIIGSFKISASEDGLVKVFSFIFSCFLIVLYFISVFLVGFSFDIVIGLLFSPVFFVVALINRKK